MGIETFIQAPNAPCRDCKDRWITENDRCHSHCERYISWKNAYTKLVSDVNSAKSRETYNVVSALHSNREKNYMRERKHRKK